MSLILGKEYGGIYEGWELIADVSVITNSTTVTISGLDGDKDEEYIIITMVINRSGAEASYALDPNNVGVNLSCQRLWCDGTAINSSSLTTGMWTESVLDGEDYLVVWHLYAKSGKQRRCVYHQSLRTTVRLGLSIGLWDDTITKITSLVFESGVTNGIGNGSRILLFKKRG